MENRFNLKRALLLARSILLINRRSIKWTLFTSICILFFSTIIDIASSSIEFYFTEVSYSIISVIVVITMTVVAYMKYNVKWYVNTTYMLPSSSNEKFFVPFFMSLILAPVVLYVIYIVLLSFGWLILQSINGGTISYLDTITQNAINGYYISEQPFLLPIALAFTHSFCCLCTMLLGKYAWVRIIVLFDVVFLSDKPDIPYWLIFKDGYIFFDIMLLLTPLFWLISYLRFRKIELKK